MDIYKSKYTGQQIDDLLNAAGNMDDTIYDTIVDTLGKVRTINLLSTGWSAVVPFVQTVPVSGIVGTMTPIVDIVLSDDIDSAKKEKTEWGYIDKAVTGNGTITFTCYESKPTVQLVVQVKGV